MSFEDALDREEFEEITVAQFFTEFQKTCRDEKKSFYIFKELLDCGVKLRRAEKGFLGEDDCIHKSDIGVAISKAKRTLDIGAKSATVPTRHKSGQLDQINISELFIRKNEVMMAYSDRGESDFPWSNGTQLIDPDVVQKEDDAVYLTLFEAISKILNISKVSATDVDAMNLVSRVERGRGSWNVRERVRGDESYVLLPDFIEWAWKNGYKTTEEVVESFHGNLSAEFLDMFRLSLIDKEIKELKQAKCDDIDGQRWRANKITLLEKEKMKILGDGGYDKNKKKKSILDKRIEALAQWLESENIPKSKWLDLDEYTLKEMYRILIDKYPDQFYVKGYPMEMSTFERKFWRKQSICKLKQK